MSNRKVVILVASYKILSRLSVLVRFICNQAILKHLPVYNLQIMSGLSLACNDNAAALSLVL
ncbi:MAG: hypothetical protein ACI9C4_000548 [Paraglaciecola sp.]|jgi:hypothetical protein